MRHDIITYSGEAITPLRQKSHLSRFKSIMNRYVLMTSLALSTLPLYVEGSDQKSVAESSVLHITDTIQGRYDYLMTQLQAKEDSLESRMLNLESLNPDIVKKVIENSDKRGKFSLSLEDVIAITNNNFQNLKGKEKSKAWELANYTYHLYPHLHEIEERVNVYDKLSVEELVALSIVESSGANPDNLKNKKSSAKGPLHVLDGTWRFSENLLKDQNPLRYTEYTQMNFLQRGWEVGSFYFNYLKETLSNPSYAPRAYYAGPYRDLFGWGANHFNKKFQNAKQIYRKIDQNIADLNEFKRLYEERKQIPGYRAVVARDYQTEFNNIIKRNEQYSYNVPVPNDLYKYSKNKKSKNSHNH